MASSPKTWSSSECQPCHLSVNQPLTDRFFCFARDLSAFAKPGVDKDVANLRFKHYQDRLIDLINEMLFERKRIKEAHHKLDNRNLTMRSASPNYPQGDSQALQNNQTSQAQMSRSPGSIPNVLHPLQRQSGLNVLQDMQTPHKRPSQMDFNDNAGTFLTDFKTGGPTLKDSNMAILNS